MNRIEKLQKYLGKEKLAALIIDNPIDIFYLTGMQLSLGRLVLDKKGASLIVDGRYFEACKKQKAVEPILLSEKALDEVVKRVKGKKVAFDSGYTTYANYLQLDKALGKKFELVPRETPLALVRAIKEKSEIEAIKKASSLNVRGYNYAVSLLKLGITEEEVAKKIELFFLQNGGEQLSFSPIVAFGENAALPHYRPHMKRKLKKGDCVLIDMGVTVDHYCSDLTRVTFFGPPAKKMKEVYLTVKKAVQAALKICKSGVKISDLDYTARDLIAKKGYGDFFTHSLGHGVGLEIHEYPRIKEGAKGVIEEGMVITIEPGIYLPGVGGVRLEEMILVKKNGYENLTPIPFIL